MLEFSQTGWLFSSCASTAVLLIVCSEGACPPCMVDASSTHSQAIARDHVNACACEGGARTTMWGPKKNLCSATCLAVILDASSDFNQLLPGVLNTLMVETWPIQLQESQKVALELQAIPNVEHERAERESAHI